MKIRVTTTSKCSSPEELIEKYPALGNFGFSIEPETIPYTTYIRDENNKCIKQDEYKTVLIPYIHIDRVEQLFELSDAIEQELIICWADDEIEIYDDCRE